MDDASAWKPLSPASHRIQSSPSPRPQLKCPFPGRPAWPHHLEHHYPFTCYSPAYFTFLCVTSRYLTLHDLHFIWITFKLYSEVISNVQKRCKHCTEDSHISVTQNPQMLTFKHICFIVPSLYWEIIFLNHLLRCWSKAHVRPLPYLSPYFLQARTFSYMWTTYNHPDQDTDTDTLLSPDLQMPVKDCPWSQ